MENECMLRTHSYRLVQKEEHLPLYTLTGLILTLSCFINPSSLYTFKLQKYLWCLDRYHSPCEQEFVHILKLRPDRRDERKGRPPDSLLSKATDGFVLSLKLLSLYLSGWSLFFHPPVTFDNSSRLRIPIKLGFGAETPSCYIFPPLFSIIPLSTAMPCHSGCKKEEH